MCAMLPELHALHGAPESVWLDIRVADRQDPIEVDFRLFNKSKTRLPEAGFVTFRPDTHGEGQWQMDKLGTWLDPRDALNGSTHGLHAVSRGVRYTDGGGRAAMFETVDAGVVRWGEPFPFPTPMFTHGHTCSQPIDWGEGASFMLWNNIYSTNYVMWFPYSDADRAGDLLFRFRMML